MDLIGDAATRAEELKKHYGISTVKDLVSFLLFQEYRRIRKDSNAPTA